MSLGEQIKVTRRQQYEFTVSWRVDSGLSANRLGLHGATNMNLESLGEQIKVSRRVS